MARTAAVSERQVLDVAGRLFYARGIRATGVAEVVAAVGCGKQALYRIFPSKDDLVAAYLASVVAEREASDDRAVERAGGDPAEQLVALTENVTVWAGRRGFRGCAMRNYLREYPVEQTAARRVAEGYLTRSRHRIALLAESARPGEGAAVADAVWLVHEGLYGNSRANRVNLPAGVDLVRSLVSPVT